MYLFNNTRENFLRFLPKNAVVAEIGVATGDFSAQILALSNPKRFHLIDPWVHQSIDEYKDDPNNVGKAEADKRYEAIEQKFCDEIKSGQIVVDRDFSTNAALNFPDGYFDWIYVDAMHTSQAVSADLHTYWPKIKAGGLLLGHDYANNEGSRNMKFGVVEAVNDFIDQIGCEFTALNIEAFPTYILSKDTSSEAYAFFVAHALRHLELVAKIGNVTQKKYKQTVAKFSDGASRIFPVFE